MSNEEKIENCKCTFNTGYPIYSLALRGDKLFIGGGKPNQAPILSCYTRKENDFKLVAKKNSKIMYILFQVLQFIQRKE